MQIPDPQNLILFLIPLHNIQLAITNVPGKFIHIVSSTGIAQSTLGGMGGNTFVAGKYMHGKLTKCPNFTRHLPVNTFRKFGRYPHLLQKILNLVTNNGGHRP